MSIDVNSLVGKIIHADCLSILRGIYGGVALVLTDPPYPDYHAELYGYDPEPILALGNIDCRQLVFWTAKEPFLLSHSAVHIWDKKTGCGSQYERIFERNGGKECRVYRHYLINSTVAASYARDEFTGHPSQKPIALIKELVSQFSNVNDVVLDPFCGSGSVAVACHALNRRFICIERDERWYNVARNRLRDAQAQLSLFDRRENGTCGSSENSAQQGQPETAQLEIGL